MQYIATIEIPKGSDRRIHLAYDKSGFIDLGPIKEHVPVNEGVMPVHYGYIEGTVNKEEGDEVDVILFSKKPYNTGDKVEIEILGMLTREDGDHKVIARDDSESDSVFQELTESERKLIMDYMGYKSPIASVDSRELALEYVKKSLVKAA
jgi:inorganic pyrophosphatase